MNAIKLFALLAVTTLFAQEWDTVYNVPNYANGKRPLPVWVDYTHYMGGNWSQLEMHTVLGGDKHVIIEGGNVKNCDPGPNTEFRNCYQDGNHVDYCAHLHDEWSLDAEPDSCSHVDSIVVYMDGADTVSVEYFRSDRRVP